MFRQIMKVREAVGIVSFSGFVEQDSETVTSQ